MENITSIEQVQTLISNIRNQRKGFLTNFYFDSFKHGIWISNGDLSYEILNGSLFLVRSSKDFCNLFYCSTTIEDLKIALLLFDKKYPELTRTVDVVGPEKQCTPVMEAFRQCGYLPYRELVRMSRITPADVFIPYDGKVIKASIDDSTKIKNILDCYFDAKCEQIPYKEEIVQYVQDGKILVLKENDDILGFVIFETKRASHYLRYWFVHPMHRDMKIGSSLLNQFFYEGRQTKRQFFWVITDNENAIKRYRHYGFTDEDMKDYIMGKNIEGQRPLQFGGNTSIINLLYFHNYKIAA